MVRNRARSTRSTERARATNVFSLCRPHKHSRQAESRTGIEFKGQSYPGDFSPHPLEAVLFRLYWPGFFSRHFFSTCLTKRSIVSGAPAGFFAESFAASSKFVAVGGFEASVTSHFPSRSAISGNRGPCSCSRISGISLRNVLTMLERNLQAFQNKAGAKGSAWPQSRHW